MSNLSSIPQFLVLFDAECLLCQKAVHIIIKHGDPKTIQLCSLQDFKLVYADKIHQDSAWQEAFQTDSLLVFDHNEWHTRASAALKVGARLHGWPAKAARALSILPLFLLTLGYRFIARYRLLIFGKTDSCLNPNLEAKDFFWNPKNNEPPESV